MEDIKLANQLCFSVYNTSRLFTKFYQKALSEFNLTYPQYLVLLALWEEDHQTLHQIGRRLRLESNTLTPLLRRMEQAGWIIREKSPEDKRQLGIRLKDKGREAQEPIQAAIAECIGHEHLDISQYREVHETIVKLEETLRTVLSEDTDKTMEKFNGTI
ncbi:MarR family winged helix-turn-helix transcriptional regulator [Salinicoccus bachuensis]|uniref:MarR family winged helix-turn-helix transcriptional regulator n=1 Tax=Salinicoccus bachuensis TaxID=3136731 RepID=A0ABZ3CFR3_9STAP